MPQSKKFPRGVSLGVSVEASLFHLGHWNAPWGATRECLIKLIGLAGKSGVARENGAVMFSQQKGPLIVQRPGGTHNIIVFLFDTTRSARTCPKLP
jgi:hypothetical protein